MNNVVVSADAFDHMLNVPMNDSLVHQVVTSYMSSGRAGTKAQKNRAAVRGGGRKPWRQKGTGRARAGTIRSPLWRGGGQTFATSPRSYAKKVNRKMYRGAMRAIFSQLVRDNRLTIIESIAIDSHKTKSARELIRALEIKEHVLFIVHEYGDELLLATRNLPYVDVLSADDIDPLSLIYFSHIVVESAALEKISNRLLGNMS